MANADDTLNITSGNIDFGSGIFNDGGTVSLKDNATISDNTAVHKKWGEVFTRLGKGRGLRGATASMQCYGFWM